MSAINHSRVRKLLCLALDAAASPGEVDNAAVMLVAHLRSAGASPEDLLAGGASTVRERIVYRDRPAPVAVIRMPFGKHKGEPVAEIDPGYLQWVLNNCTRIDDYLVAEIRRVLNLGGEE